MPCLLLDKAKSDPEGHGVSVASVEAVRLLGIRGGDSGIASPHYNISQVSSYG